jgi:hypothetical protein
LVFSFGTLFAQQQIENGGFENWEEVGLGADLMEPVDWSSIKTSDIASLNTAAPVVWFISNDAHSGMHSLHLKNASVFGIIATGTITNGRVHADFNPDNGYVFTDVNDAQWNSPISARPDSVIGWYKSNPTSGDFGTFKIALHTNDLNLPGDDANIVAEAYLEFPSVVVTEWTRFSIPFEYFQYGMPDYYLSVITSGNGTSALANSEIWYDDIKFVYNPQSVGEDKLDNLLVYSSNGSILLERKDQSNHDYQVFVSDLMGRQVFKGSLLSQDRNLKINNKLSGVYVVSIFNGSKKYSTKVVVN